jgi:glycosyltransferase involved in cell wall biosynthesis
MSTPLVSFIVPCYNASRYLPEFFESIQSQTFRDFEVLIGDDGSSDNTIELVQPMLRDPRFKLISWKPNRGMHHGVVLLLNEARGQYWCPPGSDDILDPRFLEKRVPQLAGRPEAVLIHGAAKWIDENNKPYITDNTTRGLPELSRRLPESMPAARMLRVLLQHNLINWPSTLVRSDITRLVMPYFSPYWAWAMDWVLWILLAATGYDFLWDEEPLIQYRMHSQSLSGSPQKRVIRQIERKLAPFCALRAASVFSPVARVLWVQERTALYRWWLASAANLRWNGALKSRDMSFAVEAYCGALPHSVNLWRELVIHGLPAFLQYRREKQANRGQLFEVSGLSLMDDPLFKSA